MKLYIYTALFIGYVTGVALFTTLGLGLDIHIHDRYFVIPLASAGFLVVAAPAVILILLIQREMRRKRLAESSSQ
jgi:hypothetical protein